jgi:hypothetical protein
VSSYLRRLSLRFLLNELLHHSGENGPGGIRTRICSFDRVLCSPYTTGPKRACSRAVGKARLQITVWFSACRIGTGDAASVIGPTLSHRTRQGSATPIFIGTPSTPKDARGHRGKPTPTAFVIVVPFVVLRTSTTSPVFAACGLRPMRQRLGLSSLRRGLRLLQVIL